MTQKRKRRRASSRTGRDPSSAPSESELYVEFLRHIATVANESESPRQLCGSIFENVCHFTGWGSGMLMEADPATGELVSSGVWYPPKPSSKAEAELRRRVDAFRPTAEGVTLPSQVLRTGKAKWGFLRELLEQREPNSIVSVAHKAGMRTFLAFPVFCGDEIVAELCFVAGTETPPDEAFMGVMQDVSHQVARVTERYRAAEAVRRQADQLRAVNIALARKNAALEEVLASLDDSKRQTGEEIVANVEKVILPMLRSLRPGLSGKRLRVLEQVEASLAELTRPFVSALGREFASLSPTEVRICNHIRAGMLTKQIAQVEGISSGTVSRHREGIRRKLGLAHTGANLTTFLQEFGGQS